MMTNYCLIIYPYKTNKFIYDTFEINQLKNYTKIYLIDISYIVNKSFTNSLNYKHNIYNEHLIIIKTWKDYILFLYKNRKKVNVNIFIIDEISFSPNFKELISILFYRIILFGKIKKVLKILNSGVPVIEFDNLNNKNPFSIYQYIIKNTKLFLNKVIIRIDIVLIAGKDMSDKFSKYFKRKKIINYNSNDFSKFILNTKSNNKLFNNEYAVFLDSAGPLFTSDSSLTKSKVYFTVDNWYPSLCIFFNFLENIFSNEIKIAGHYKSIHKHISPHFGNRKVYYNITQELVRNCNFVVTRNSTAISYAIIYNKPIFFIYSNETIKDKNQMIYIKYLSKITNCKIININDFKNGLDFSNLLKIDESKYEEFKLNYLTSLDLNNLKPNYKILVEEVLKN